MWKAAHDPAPGLATGAHPVTPSHAAHASPDLAPRHRAHTARNTNQAHPAPIWRAGIAVAPAPPHRASTARLSRTPQRKPVSSLPPHPGPWPLDPSHQWSTSAVSPEIHALPPPHIAAIRTIEFAVSPRPSACIPGTIPSAPLSALSACSAVKTSSRPPFWIQLVSLFAFPPWSTSMISREIHKVLPGQRRGQDRHHAPPATHH